MYLIHLTGVLQLRFYRILFPSVNQQHSPTTFHYKVVTQYIEYALILIR